jgi:hypothetical protein
VLNGAARDMAEPPDIDLLLHCAPGKPTALNEAMAALPGELLAIRDDDDVSMPGDLRECRDEYLRTGAEVVSRLRHRVMLDGERWLFAEHLASQWGNHAVWGGSLMFRNIPDVPTFPDELVSESQSWARAMIALGARVWRPSTEHQIHVRQSFCGMWGAGPLEVRRTLGFKDRARRYKDDGSFVWEPCPTMLEVAEEKLSTEREYRPMWSLGAVCASGSGLAV